MTINPRLENDIESIKVILRKIRRTSASGSIHYEVGEAMRKVEELQRKLRNREYEWS